MRRLKCEKEKIILTNEDDGFYDDRDGLGLFGRICFR